jgi:hypothetical protein
LALNCRSFAVNCFRAAVYFLLRIIRSSWSRELIPEYDYADDFTAEDYPTPGSCPTDFENLLDIAI